MKAAPDKSRIDAILKLQPPSNRKEIHENKGMLNFSSKNNHKMHLYLRPLHDLLRQQKTWNKHRNIKIILMN